MDNNSVNNGAGTSTAASASVNPLDKLESAISAARQSAQSAGAPAGTPQDQFVTQFGSASQPPAQPTEVPAVPDISGLASESTAAPVVTEASFQPLLSPAEKLKKQISDNVDKFLEEVAKEKTAV